jgi:hypothetical protein
MPVMPSGQPKGDRGGRGITKFTVLNMNWHLASRPLETLNSYSFTKMVVLMPASGVRELLSNTSGTCNSGSGSGGNHGCRRPASTELLSASNRPATKPGSFSCQRGDLVAPGVGGSVA